MQINVPADSLRQIKYLAMESPEAESCGYLFKTGDVLEVLNHADDPEMQFKIAAEDHLLASRDERGIAAIWHSHLNCPELTEADFRASYQLKIPYLVIDLQTQTFDYYDPNRIESLVGREWKSFRTNCYSLVKDYYQQELNIELPMYWLDESRIYDEDYDPIGTNYEDYFNKLPPSYDLLDHDLLVFKIGTPNPLHFAVVTDVNQNKMLHHPLGALSRYDIISHSWIKHCHYVLRYKGALNA
jgi:proteasome lid subunit RPN8/RPN11